MLLTTSAIDLLLSRPRLAAGADDRSTVDPEVAAARGRTGAVHDSCVAHYQVCMRRCHSFPSRSVTLDSTVRMPAKSERAFRISWPTIGKAAQGDHLKCVCTDADVSTVNYNENRELPNNFIRLLPGSSNVGVFLLTKFFYCSAAPKNVIH